MMHIFGLIYGRQQQRIESMNMTLRWQGWWHTTTAWRHGLEIDHLRSCQMNTSLQRNMTTLQLVFLSLATMS